MKSKKKSPIPISTPATPKPILVQCGKHFIDPFDVASIKEAKRGLYIVKLKSEPNPEWPIWVEELYLGGLLAHFDIREEEE